MDTLAYIEYRSCLSIILKHELEIIIISWPSYMYDLYLLHSKMKPTTVGRFTHSTPTTTCSTEHSKLAAKYFLLSLHALEVYVFPPQLKSSVGTGKYSEGNVITMCTMEEHARHCGAIPHGSYRDTSTGSSIQLYYCWRSGSNEGL